MTNGIREIGIIVPTTETVDECVKQAREAEKAGFGTVWLGEAYHYFRKAGLEVRSATSVAAAIGLNTRKVKIGFGVLSPYTRHPVLLAMEAATLDEITHGRLLFGLGVAKTVLLHIGIDTNEKIKAIPTMRESIQIIRQILSGKAFDFHGEVFSADAPTYDGRKTYRSDIPIYLGPTGPKLMQLTGELCDGLITSSITTPGWIRYAVEQAKDGARRAGRDLSRFDIGGVLVCSVDEDGERARNQARRTVATYLGVKVLNIGENAKRQLEKGGIKYEEVKPIVDAIRSQDVISATEAVGDDLLKRAAPLVGTPDECVKALREFARCGMKHPMLEIVGDTSRAIKLFSDKVTPEIISGA